MFFFHYYKMLNINTLDSLHTQFQLRSHKLYIISTYDFHFMFCLILYYELFNTTTHSLIILIFIYTLIQYNCHIYITITKLCHFIHASIFILNPHFCCSIATCALLFLLLLWQPLFIAAIQMPPYIGASQSSFIAASQMVS